MKVEVRNGDVEYALRVLRKKLQRSGFYKEMKLRNRGFEKPSETRKRQHAAAVRRAAKKRRTQLELDGAIPKKKRREQTHG
jgi:small subunit ribosomal protein S21